MARVSITEGELIAALAEAARGSAPEDARTIQELATEYGMPLKRVRAALHALNVAGRLAVHRVTRAALDGRQASVPAYTILPAKAKR